ncbi:dihydroorotase [Candidatus Peregrinibacteria bacterium CG10_big_fil_rev_8_21_14_0_10_36_19]|nr:MAG: dihydroorotase [Candidatus Peregrinibacteria bacterium CG10_big_fil_rev_8_21_14_0_10_36_19]
MKKYVLKGGEVVTDLGSELRDLYLADGKVVEAGDGFEEIDCTGKLILPGIIDIHVHFREPGGEAKEDWESASRSAVFGGVTTVCDMPNNNPAILSRENLEMKRALISGRSYANYGLYIGYNGKNIDEINAAEGIFGVKVYCAHSTGNMGVEGDYLEEAFKEIRRDVRLFFHSEDEHIIDENKSKFTYGGVELHSKIRSDEAALSMTKKLCELAAKYERPIHICHVSTEAEVDLIDQYEWVTCEVAPHHLVLSTDDYGHLGTYGKMNPPLRDAKNVFGLWKAVKSGMVQLIATDHAPHLSEEKEVDDWRDAPSGVPGVEMLLPIFLNVVNDDGLTIQEVVSLCSKAPAELFGMKGKGRLEVGFDADVVVVDMDLEREFKNEDVQSKCGWSPYAGTVYKGWPVMTFVNGELVFKDGEIVGEKVGKEILVS